MSEREIITRRLLLAAIGAIAGLSQWVLLDVLSDGALTDRLFLLLAVLSIGFFGPMLGMIGPLSPARAGISAALVAVPTGLLMVWASFRFAEVERFLDNGHPFVAAFLLLTIPLPFLVAQGLGRGWRDYPTLFTEAWGIVVRYAAAIVFTGLFWLVLYLSDELLQLVGVTIIDWLIDIDAVPYLLTGIVFGLAIAVVNELSDYVSPNLILRLLRLLLPFVLVIVAIFIAALPLRGLSDVFGSFSAAATLMTITLGAATLITTALDIADDRAVRSPVMRASAQALAVLMPVLAALAVYAIWIRVAEYGWTPDRLAAAALALVTLGYAGLYAIAILRRAAWMEHVRQANIVKAGIIVLIAVLWLTPILNPQRITVSSQLSRLESGAISAAEFDVWSFLKEWGRAGEAAKDRLVAAVPEDQRTVLTERIARAEAAEYRWDFVNEDRLVSDAPKREEIATKIIAYPAKTPLAASALAGLRAFELENLAKACDRTTQVGNTACVAVLADFLPDEDGDEVALIFAPTKDSLNFIVYSGGENPRQLGWDRISGPHVYPEGETLIDAVFADGFSIRTPRVKSLVLKDTEIFIHP